MDNKKTVVVLGLNGRRHTVKIDPNSTILQILEEVCTKQGLKPEQYDIKHHNKCLDPSTIIRFSGLPNNAQLELVEAVKVRLEGLITLGVQLENGSRLVGSFTPDNTLWEVLTQLCPDEANPATNPLIIYMRRNIYGQSTFEDTNLRSLGITSGRAMLRLLHRSPEDLGTQANISAPLPTKPVEEKPYVRKLQKSDAPPEKPLPKQEPTVLESIQPAAEVKPLLSKKTDLLSKIKEEKRKHTDSHSLKTCSKQSEHNKQAKDQAEANENTVDDIDFIFLGTRNAMVFSQETSHAIPTEDLPDDFFELTINDAKKLLRDIKRRRVEFDNTPLQTSGLRNLEQSKKEISLLNKYKMAIIRIHFPDHTVLQGTFKPTDTIHDVMEFVKEYLECSKTSFYLYMAPPKKILNANDRLMEIGCVPNAILYFGTDVLSKDEKYLRRDLIHKFTTASLASLAAVKIRKENTRATTKQESNDDISFDVSDVNVGASTSTAAETRYEDYPASSVRVSQPQNVPKWYKPT